MDIEEIKQKFGNEYEADDYSFIMGIDIRFSDHLAKRFKDLIVLETCSGGGFTTISLAKYAKHVYSIEIDSDRIQKAMRNSEIAGVDDKITFINGDVMSESILKQLQKVDSAFIDPDWAITGDNHIFRFKNSLTKPPSDKIFELISNLTMNITLIQPPYIDKNEFKNLPSHESEYLYLNNQHELYGLHFGQLVKKVGDTRFDII